MLFTSPLFLFTFLPLTLLAYYGPLRWSRRLQNLLLLGVSLVFYGYGEPAFIKILIVSVFANWAAGWVVGEHARFRKLAMWASVAANVGLLFYFKYLAFGVGQINACFGTAWRVPDIVLPLGISFFTFQAMSYVLDIYQGKSRPQRNPLDVGLYIVLFPQLIAGPIVRYTTIRDEMKDRRWIPDNVFSGLQRFASGLAKKVLLADTFALVADTVFKSPAAEIPCAFAWIGVAAYALQIFYDFSGYSDMAIGLGRVFNFHFLENFDHPYCATSIREFWRRWHISLSTWFRDYLYIPLGGNRVSFARTCLNQAIVFFLCGLWHGADWNFVVWGLLHGLGLSAERLLLRSKRLAALRIPPILGNLYVWLFVLVGWVFFRSPSLDYALAFLKVMFAGNASHTFFSFWPALGFYHHGLLVAGAIGLVLCYPALPVRVARLERRPAGAALSLAVFLVAYAFAMTSHYSPFIYFRF